MASCPTLKRAKCSVGHHLQLFFPSQATKEDFLARLDRAKQRMFPEGGTVDNYPLLTGLLDALEGQAVGDEAQTEGFDTPAPTPLGFLRLVLHPYFFLAVSLCLFYFHHH